VQNLEFVTDPDQTQETSFMLLNASSIMVDVSFEPNTYAELFTIVPENCQLEPGGTTEVFARFFAPRANAQSTVYERSVTH